MARTVNLDFGHLYLSAVIQCNTFVLLSIYGKCCNYQL
jgi:hypothetical protein